MGNARLLTMIGDGHTAYKGESACVDAAVENYLLGGTLPAAGTICKQDVTFSGVPTSGYPSLAPSPTAPTQKVGPKGGKPEGACDKPGTFASVPYSADYVFLHKA